MALASGAAPCLAAGHWNGYEEVEQSYVWRRGDTLAEVLFRLGLGKAKGPLQLYGAKGWVRRNSERNQGIKNWRDVTAGTTVVLVLPAELQVSPVSSQRPLPLSTVLAPPPPPPVQSLLAPGEVEVLAEEALDNEDEDISFPQDGGSESAWHLPKAFHPQRLRAFSKRLWQHRSWLLGCGVAALGLAAVIILFRRRDSRLMQGRQRRALLKGATEVYARTGGSMSLGDPALLETVEAAQLRLKAALFEGLLLAPEPQRAALTQTYGELGYFYADAVVLQALRSIGSTKHEANDAELQQLWRQPSPSLSPFLRYLRARPAELEEQVKPYLRRAARPTATLPRQTSATKLPPAFPEALARLREVHGEPFAHKAVERFLATAPSRLASLQAAAQAGLYDLVVAEAAELRTACLNLGAAALAALLATVAGKAKVSEAVELLATLDRLPSEFADLAAVLHYSWQAPYAAAGDKLSTFR